MSSTFHARGIFEHIRRICERPQTFAPGFTLDHFHLFLAGYDSALGDAGIAGQCRRFDEWLYRQHPKWRQSPEWWAQHILHANGENLDQTLAEILRLVDQFLATDGAEFNLPRPHPPET